MSRTPVLIVLLVAVLVAIAALFLTKQDEMPGTSAVPAKEAAAAKDAPERAVAAGGAEAAARADRSAATPAGGGAPAVASSLAELAGRVVASESSAAIEGARVSVESADVVFFGIGDEPKPVDNPGATTDAQGRFRIKDIAPGAPCRLKVEAPGRVGQRVALSPLGARESRTAGDIALALGGVLDGRVTDRLGSPIAGARVAARRASAPRVTMLPAPPVWLALQATTDDAGRYRIDGVPTGEAVLVRASTDRHLSSQSDPIEPRAGETRTVADLVLRDGQEIAGRIVDRDGAPVAGARVTAARMGTLQSLEDFGVEGRRVTTTGADGRFTLAGLEDKPVQLTARAEKKGMARKRDVAPGTRDLTIELQSLGAIRGRVVLTPPSPDDASALAAFRVYAQRSSAKGALGIEGPAVEGNAIPGGRFEIEALEPGKYRVFAEGDGFAPAVSERIEVDPARPVEGLQIAVSRGASLDVAVVASGSGDPIAAATVRLREIREEGEDAVFRDAGDEDDPPAGGVTVRSGGGGERRSVRVRGNAGPSGTRIFGGDAPDPVSRSVETDEKGIARFTGLPAGQYRVSARKTGLAPSAHETRTVDPATPSPVVKLALARGGSVEGFVRRGTAAASGATVELIGPEPTVQRKKTTADADGRYAFEHLRAGAYHIALAKASPAGNFVVMDDDDATTGIALEVVDGKATPQDLEAPAVAAIVGRVTQAGAPVAGAHVTAELASSQAVAMGLPGMDGGKSAVTGPDGRFRIDDLEAGRWRVRASRGSALKRTEREVELRGGEEKIEIVLPRGAIEGRVVRADDHQPVANASVSLVDADRGGPQRQMIMVAVTSDSDGSGPEIVTGDGMARTKTDADGKFRIDDLPAGKYRVKGTAAGLREGTSADISLGDDALVNGVELALEKAASLVGRVTSPSGGARPQTVVRAVPKDGPNGPPKIAVTDAEGRYRFTSLDPGEYRLFTGLNFGAAASAGQLVTLEAGKEATKDLVVED